MFLFGHFGEKNNEIFEKSLKSNSRISQIKPCSEDNYGKLFYTEVSINQKRS